jgi:uncharacterized protein
MIRRAIVAGALATATTVILAGPAAAHVTIDPPSVPKGSTSQLSFIVPNESATARTNRVQVVFPQPPDAIPEVSVAPMPGWRASVRKQQLDSPIATDDGSISEIVTWITWTATSIADTIGPDQYGTFSINADGIPDDTDELVFRVVQGRTDGSSVRWVDPVSDAGPEAQHPTPILVLTDGADSGTGEPPATTAPPSDGDVDDLAGGATTITTQDDNARALAVIGIVVGGVALVAATGALMRRRRAR